MGQARHYRALVLLAGLPLPGASLSRSLLCTHAGYGLRFCAPVIGLWLIAIELSRALRDLPSLSMLRCTRVRIAASPSAGSDT